MNVCIHVKKIRFVIMENVNPIKVKIAQLVPKIVPVKLILSAKIIHVSLVPALLNTDDATTIQLKNVVTIVPIGAPSKPAIKDNNAKIAPVKPLVVTVDASQHNKKHVQPVHKIVPVTPNKLAKTVNAKRASVNVEKNDVLAPASNNAPPIASLGNSSKTALPIINSIATNIQSLVNA
jgi:hypothetical protein